MMSATEKTVSLRMAAKIAGKSKSTICRAIQAGKIPAQKHKNGTYMIKPSDAASYYRSQPIRSTEYMAKTTGFPLFNQKLDSFDLINFCKNVAETDQQIKTLVTALDELLSVHIALCRVSGFTNIGNRKEIKDARSALDNVRVC
jgi:adenylate cyclase